jgi:YD repeat-containing protein
LFLFLRSLCALRSQASAVDYEYDALGRLIKADYGNGKFVEYVYDKNGNRTSVIVETKTTDATSPTNQTNMIVVPMGGSFVLVLEEDE